MTLSRRQLLWLATQGDRTTDDLFIKDGKLCVSYYRCRDSNRHQEAGEYLVEIPEDRYIPDIPASVLSPIVIRKKD